MRKQEGVSIVEVVVSVTVAAIFIQSLVLLVVTSYQVQRLNTELDEARNLAYGNLRFIIGDNRTAWIDCTTVTSAPDSTQTITLSTANSLPSPVTQTIRISAPYGCSGSSEKLPYKVLSEVVYGPSNRKVVHAGYAQK